MRLSHDLMSYCMKLHLCSAFCTHTPTATAFENIYKKYLQPRTPAAVGTTGSNLEATEANVLRTTNTENTNYSAVVANRPAMKSTAEIDKSVFSPMVGRQAPPEAKNQPACKEVSFLPPSEEYISQNAMSEGFGIEQSNLSNAHPTHSQPPPPDYSFLPHMNFQSQQQPSSYLSAYFPYVIGSHTSNLMGLQGLPGAVSNTPKELETLGAGIGKSTTDFLVHPNQKWNGDYVDPWNQSGSGVGGLLRNVWKDEDPISGSSTRKSDFNLLPTSQPSYEAKSLDEFVHQSQVEDDTFQPYASIKQSPVIPAIAKRKGERDGNNALDKRKGDLLDSAVTMVAPLASGNSNTYRNPFGAPGTSYIAGLNSNTANSNRSTTDSSFMCSTDGGVLSFTGGGNGGGGNIERRSSHDTVKDDDIFESDLSNKSNSPEAAGVHTRCGDHIDGLFDCILCYRNCQTSERLASHCSTDLDHLELAMLDSGAEEIWKFPPPPPHRLYGVEMCRRW